MSALIQKENPSIAILEHLWNIESLRRLKRKFKKIKYILNAHNVKSLNTQRYLQLNRLNSNKVIDAQTKQINRLESKLEKYVDCFWACSKNDANMLTVLNQKKLFLVLSSRTALI